MSTLAAAFSACVDIDLRVVPHLYDLAADGPAVQALRSTPGDLIVLASLYPRAAFWVLNAHGVEGRMRWSKFMPDEAAADDQREAGNGSERSIWCIDLRPHGEARPLAAEIERIATEATGKPIALLDDLPDDEIEADAEKATQVAEETPLRWYPVIDYGRCRNCLECLNFCLFGVFGIDQEGKILVEQPEACRSGCPACSRVCPAEAIMFPQHHTPVIAGDPTAPSDGFNTGLVQLLGMPSPVDVAAAERDRALSQKAKADEPAEKDELDRLVDELDEIDL